jgi:hypothetical protein
MNVDVAPLAERNGGRKMEIAKRVITKLPLEELWNEDANLNAQRVSTGLRAASIATLPQNGTSPMSSH